MAGVIGNILGKLVKGLVGSGAVGSLVGSLFQRLNNASLSGKEREQNAWNAEQADIQRQFASSEREASQAFNAQQAQAQMDFQERMANTSYQRGVADMKAAGVNPALAYSQGGAVAPSGAAASSSPAAGAAASGSSQLMSLSDIMQFAKLKKDLDLADAEIADKYAGAKQKDASAGLASQQASLTAKQLNAFDERNGAEMALLHQELNNKKVREELDRQGISESEARTQVDLNNALLASIDAKYRDQLNSLNVRLRISEVALNYKRMEHLSAEINELFARAVMESANSNMMSQQTRNLAVQHGILSLDKDSKQFSVDHQKADRNWRIAGQVTSAVIGVAGAAAGVMTGAGLLSNAATNASRLSWQQTVSAAPGSSLWTPSGTSGFGFSFGK